MHLLPSSRGRNGRGGHAFHISRRSENIHHLIRRLYLLIELGCRRSASSESCPDEIGKDTGGLFTSIRKDTYPVYQSLLFTSSRVINSPGFATSFRLWACKDLRDGIGETRFQLAARIYGPIFNLKIAPLQHVLNWREVKKN